MTTPSSVQNSDPGQNDNMPEFLADLSEADLEKIFSIGEVQEFAAGDIALTEGDRDASIYILLEGEAEVLIAAKSGWLRVATLTAGSVFGELSFFDRMPRSARVSVLAVCSVLKINESSFQRLRAENPNLALAFVMELSRILSLRVRHMNGLIQTLTK